MTHCRRAAQVGPALLVLCMAASCAGGAKKRPAASAADPSARLRHEFVMPQAVDGADVRVVVYCADGEAARRAERAVSDRLADFQQLFDLGRPDSEVSRIHANAGLGPIRVADEMYGLLRQVVRLSERSDGAIEPTAGAYDVLWQARAADGRLPSESELAQADAEVGPEKLRLDPIERTVLLTERGTRLDLSPFLRGYACDHLIHALDTAGFPIALVDAGRRIAVGDAPPGTEGWPIRVNNADRKAPERTLMLERRAIASSGPVGDLAVIDGRPYARFMDPRTAIGARSLAAATVVARRGWQADALARAAAVLGERRGRHLVQSLRNARAWFHYPPGVAAEQSEPSAASHPADKPAPARRAPPTDSMTDGMEVDALAR